MGEPADSFPHRIRVGPAGWSYQDWEGIVYPDHGSRFDHLAWLSDYFDTIEVNSSFYRIPPVTHVRSWVRRVGSNSEFRFAVKLFRGFTHEQTFPPPEEAQAFRAFLEPLHEGGRLGALLAQFPWSFRRDESSLERLERVIGGFRGFPLVVEVRHASFQHEDFYRFLEDHSAGLVNIDQPLFSDSIRPDAVTTGPLGYVRLHGRNYAKWWTHQQSWERYDYLYSAEELGPWVERAKKMAHRNEVYVVTNNHFRGQAVVNALEIRKGLGQTIEIPPPLLAAYPDRFR